jgi:hypothetical protein
LLFSSSIRCYFIKILLLSLSIQVQILPVQSMLAPSPPAFIPLFPTCLRPPALPQTLNIELSYSTHTHTHTYLPHNYLCLLLTFGYFLCSLLLLGRLLLFSSPLLHYTLGHLLRIDLPRHGSFSIFSTGSIIWLN